MLKETTLASSSALELLGPGDFLAPPLSATRQLELRAVSRYLALGGVSIAALGVRFRRVAVRWPQLSEFLHGQIAEQARRAAMHLAMLHLPLAEDRILALFAELGERFGRVTPDGILIDLPLNHELIGRLTASRRPTATLALQHLDHQGLLTRLADNSWKLALSGTTTDTPAARALRGFAVCPLLPARTARPRGCEAGRLRDEPSCRGPSARARMSRRRGVLLCPRERYFVGGKLAPPKRGKRARRPRARHPELDAPRC